ncbi:hypothetical protein [Aeromonas taiwanensis]
MASEPVLISCDCHGTNVSAVVCCHLIHNNGPALGFVENSSDLNDLQAWCFACEYVFTQKEDMTDRFRKFNDMSIVCGACYAEIKAKHNSAT